VARFEAASTVCSLGSAADAVFDGAETTHTSHNKRQMVNQQRNFLILYNIFITSKEIWCTTWQQKFSEYEVVQKQYLPHKNLLGTARNFTIPLLVMRQKSWRKY
jgi:L-lactate permease